MWDVLKDYPAARVRLEAIAVKRLEKYRKEPLKKSKLWSMYFESDACVNSPNVNSCNGSKPEHTWFGGIKGKAAHE